MLSDIVSKIHFSVSCLWLYKIFCRNYRFRLTLPSPPLAVAKKKKTTNTQRNKQKVVLRDYSHGYVRTPQWLLGKLFLFSLLITTVILSLFFFLFQARDLSIAYCLVALTYIAVGFLFFISFPREKSCIQQVEFTVVVVSCLMAYRVMR